MFCSDAIDRVFAARAAVCYHPGRSTTEVQAW